MSKHSEAFEAYKTLALYMQNCYPRAEKCRECMFFARNFVCLIQRLGTYPDLAFLDDDMNIMEMKMRRLERKEKCDS